MYLNAYVAGLGVSAIVFRSAQVTVGEQREMRVWWLGVEGDERTEWVVIEASGTSHCAFVETTCGALVRAVTEERCLEWMGVAGECRVVGYDYGLAGAWSEAEAVGMSDEAAEVWRVRDMSLTDAIVRDWTDEEGFQFWMAGGGERSRGLADIAWAAAGLGADETDTLVFFARAGERYDAADWASGSVAELRKAVVELIVMTLGRATVEGARCGSWEVLDRWVWCQGCGARVAPVGHGAESMQFYCPTCWDAWVQGAQETRQAACEQCDRWTACLGARNRDAGYCWGASYCWGCWTTWAVSEGRWVTVRDQLWQAAEHELERRGRSGGGGGRGETVRGSSVGGAPAGSASGARGSAALGGGMGGGGPSGGWEGLQEGSRVGGHTLGEDLRMPERTGGVVSWMQVREAGWASPRPAIFFNSYGTEATWLSSMCRDFGFWGLVPHNESVAALLGDRQIQRYFTSRETWFCFAKCVFAAVGDHAQRNLRLADEVLCMTPQEAKRACKPTRRGGRLEGLDEGAWDATRVRMMEEGAWMQAKGSVRFRERLLRTEDALLLEASSADSFWGIGMDRASASQVPVAAQRQAFGQNWHGAALMMVRERMRREAKEGGVWVSVWSEGGGTAGDQEGGGGR